MMLKRSNHIPMSTRMDTMKRITTLVRAFFQKKMQGMTQLQST